MEDNTEIKKIYLGKLVKDIETVTNEEDKKNFVEKFDGIRKEIDIVDKYLKRDKKEEKILKSKNINELYEILEECNIENGDIEVSNLKKISSILYTLEEKIGESKSEIEKVK